MPNLWAYEIETKETIERSKVQIREKIRWFLKFADITTKADDFVETATMNPAFEESAMFENMIDLMFKNEYDVYVFDTAPTANARRLLGMSKVYALWVNKMMKSREEARTLREMLSFTKKKEADPLMEYLVSFRDRMEHARVLLTDPKLTAFYFVTLAEALPIAVVTRFIQWFKDFGIPVGGVLVNMVIDPRVARSGLRRVRQEPRGHAAGAHADDLAGVRRQRPRHRAAVRDRGPRRADAPAPVRRHLRGRRREARARWRRPAARSRSANVITAGHHSPRCSPSGRRGCSPASEQRIPSQGEKCRKLPRTAPYLKSSARLPPAGA